MLYCIVELKLNLLYTWQMSNKVCELAWKYYNYNVNDRNTPFPVLGEGKEHFHQYHIPILISHIFSYKE